jgi:hypothetical protein
MATRLYRTRRCFSTARATDLVVSAAAVCQNMGVNHRWRVMLALTALCLLTLHAIPVTTPGAQPTRVLAPGAATRLADFNEAPRDVIQRPPLLVIIGDQGGMGGVDPKTGLTRWKRVFPGLRRWEVQADTLLAVGDALVRASLDGGESRWEYPLSCDEAGRCALHVLHTSDEEILIGGIGPIPDRLMSLDPASGRHRWPSWIPLPHPVDEASPGPDRILILRRGDEPKLSALRRPAGALAWTRTLPEAGVGARARDLGAVVCLIQPSSDAPGASELLLLDPASGHPRLSRTLLDTPTTAVDCAMGPSRTVLLLDHRGVEQLDPSSLTSLRRRPLPRQATALLPLGAGWLWLSADGITALDPASLSVTRVSSYSPPASCRADDDRLHCPGLLVLLPRPRGRGGVDLLPEPTATPHIAHRGDAIWALLDGEVRRFQGRSVLGLLEAALARVSQAPPDRILADLQLLDALPAPSQAMRRGLDTLRRALLAHVLLIALQDPPALNQILPAIAATRPALVEPALHAVLTFAVLGEPDLVPIAADVLGSALGGALPTSVQRRVASCAERWDSLACDVECDRAATDCRALFRAPDACAAAERSCLATCLTAGPTYPSAASGQALGTPAWWARILGPLPD